jgi:hypothetical protein
MIARPAPAKIVAQNTLILALYPWQTKNVAKSTTSLLRTTTTPNIPAQYATIRPLAHLQTHNYCTKRLAPLKPESCPTIHTMS